MDDDDDGSTHDRTRASCVGARARGGRVGAEREFGRDVCLGAVSRARDAGGGGDVRARCGRLEVCVLDVRANRGVARDGDVERGIEIDAVRVLGRRVGSVEGVERRAEIRRRLGFSTHALHRVEFFDHDSDTISRIDPIVRLRRGGAGDTDGRRRQGGRGAQAFARAHVRVSRLAHEDGVSVFGRVRGARGCGDRGVCVVRADVTERHDASGRSRDGGESGGRRRRRLCQRRRVRSCLGRRDSGRTHGDAVTVDVRISP